MSHAISEVFKYVSEQPAFRASIGVVHSLKAAQTILLWGAVNPQTQESWVPELEDIRHSWPDAEWTPLSQQQASLFDAAYRSEQRPRQDWLLSI